MTLADAGGNVVASYSYDEYGIPLSSIESFPGGWTNRAAMMGAASVVYSTVSVLRQKDYNDTCNMKGW